MTLPTSTYRLQFRNGVTFDDAIALIPHWLDLGISHVYASPIFAATAGSTHGYDIIDPNAVDAALGGREGFDRFSRELSAAGLQLILDIVPNHLAASLENPWWRSVVERGHDSPYAGFFDIDWSRKLTLPVIAEPLQSELAAGNIRLLVEEDSAGLAIDYQGSRYPLNPDTYRNVMASLDTPFSGDPVVLDGGEILALQPWEFIRWRDAASGLSYRRFFEVTGLVGVRVEEAAVFDAMHEAVLDMVRSGRVQGLRIDHIDGLADPEEYLSRLRQAVGPDIYLVVEKILEGHERLPPEWPVSGTTGYEFIATVADVLTKSDTPELDRAYLQASPENADPSAQFLSAKAQMVDSNFRGEVQALQSLAVGMANAEGAGLDPDALNAAVRDVLIAFPVYRTYGSRRGLSTADWQVLQGVFQTLDRQSPGTRDAERNFIRSILGGDVGAVNLERAIDFRTRMQHLTGPLLAKALEDTFFYRYNRLIALNEVGGDPLARDGRVERFHEKMRERLQTQPHGLTATSTHDTKRGEDARARLYTISEAGNLWVDAVERWQIMNRHLVADLAYGPAPEPNVEWMLYQALAGVWPLDLDITSEPQLAGLRQRFLEYVSKAMREAKQRTDWGDNNQLYESAVARYAAALLSTENDRFFADFAETIQPFMLAGVHNSMTQALLKLTAPGIPDIYQGCEGFDFSLVDPDNRRPPDFDALARTPAVAAKRNLIRTLLATRNQYPALLAEGDYIPLAVEGNLRNHIIAFARNRGDQSAVVVASRLVFDQVRTGAIRSADIWRDTRVALPETWSERQWRNVLDDISVIAAGSFAVDALFAHQPYCFLMAGTK